jgi:hypothetical protein
MNKIPVGRTIAAAYGFTLSQVGSIIGLAWISLVAIAVLQFLPYAGGGNPMAMETNPLQAGQQAIQGLGISILVMLLFSVIYVAVTRLALGQKPGGAIAHFALGVPEFRTFGAILLLVLVVIGVALGAAIAGGVLTAMAAALHSEAITGIVLVLVLIAVLGAIAFIAVRLGFLVIPVTVVEEQISLSRGWILSQGNFWRILGVLLATTLPLLVLEIVATLVVVGPELFGIMAGATAHTDPQEMSNRLQQIVIHHAPVLIGLRLVFAPFQLGLSMGASAFAYRTLAGNQPS